MNDTYIMMPGSWQDWLSVFGFAIVFGFIVWRVYTTKEK